MFTWGIVVVFSTFMIQMITFGISASIGVYTIDFLNYFGEGTAATALIGSMNIGVFFGAGPLVSCLMKRFSYRKVALLGASLSTIGLICVPFATGVIYLDVFYGIIAGFGFCLLYLPSYVLVGMYFDDKHRPLATGVATSGSGVGGLVFPMLTYCLIEVYGWKGSMYILAGINLQTFIFAALLRPVEEKSSVGEDTQGQLRESEVRENTIPLIKQVPEKPQHVLRNFSYIIFLVNNVLWNMGAGLIYVLGPEYFMEVGLEKESAAFALTLSGIGNFVGAITGGSAGNTGCVNVLFLYTLSNIAYGFITLLFVLPPIHNNTGIYIVNISMGASLGMLIGVYVPIATILVGIQSLGDGMGYLTFVSGVGIGVGPIIGGLLRDSFGSYFMPICLHGGLIVLSGFLMFIIPARSLYQKKSARNFILKDASVSDICLV